MDKVMEIIEAVMDKLSKPTDFSLLLFAGIGFTMILLGIILIVGRAKARRTGDAEVEYLEVGLEPVIVYRNTEEQQKTAPDPAPVQSGTESPHTVQPPDPADSESGQEQISAPDSEPITQGALPQPESAPELQPEPEPTRDLEPEPEPDPDEPLAREAAAAFELVPFLESDLANEALAMFRNMGFSVENVVYQGFYGADFIVQRSRKQTYVHVKDWKKKITDNTVGEVLSYARNSACAHAVIISGSGFARATAKAAAKANVLLWDRKTVKKLTKNPALLSDTKITWE